MEDENNEHQEDIEKRILRLERIIQQKEIERDIKKAEEIKAKERNYDWPPID